MIDKYLVDYSTDWGTFNFSVADFKSEKSAYEYIDILKQKFNGAVEKPRTLLVSLVD